MVRQTEPKRVLLLIESDDYRKVIQLSLSMASDWEVVPSRSVSEGVAVANREEFDAILLNGDCLEESLHFLLAQPSTGKLPIIALMAGRSAEWKFFIPPGIAAVIPKLSNPLSLAERIARELHWPPPPVKY